MKILNKIKKRIKTIAIIKNEYPQEVEITKEEWEEICKELDNQNVNEFAKKVDKNGQPIIKFEGVRLVIK